VLYIDSTSLHNKRLYHNYFNKMSQQALKEAFLRYNPSFPESELKEGISYFEEQEFDAKEHILKAGETVPVLFFAESSITRCYYINPEGEEITLWMKPEQQFITEFKSFTNLEASMFSLQFYEKTKVWLISRESLSKLYKKYPSWSAFGIALTEQTHVTLIDVFVNLLANDATRNYQYIAYQFPRFLQVAPLKDIASMLQVSPVTLSRIRAGKQTKK
jgi:CRP-like cAMP-binding protein